MWFIVRQLKKLSRSCIPIITAEMELIYRNIIATGQQGLVPFDYKKRKLNDWFGLIVCNRFWWIIAFGVLLTFCGAQIEKMWIKWHRNPISIELSNRIFPISSVSFPTVTICPKTKTSKAKLDIRSIYQDIELSQLNMDNLTDLE